MYNFNIKSIISIALTTDGKIVYSNENNELDIIPIFYYGNSSTGNDIIHNELDYKRKVAYYFGSHHMGYSIYGLEQGFFQGNEKSIVDMGDFNDSVKEYQISRSKVSSKVSYVRVGERQFNNNEINVRYIVIPDAIDLNMYKNLECSKIEDLISKVQTGNIKVSDNLQFFLSGDEIERLSNFSLSLESSVFDFNSNIHPSKK